MRMANAGAECLAVAAGRRLHMWDYADKKPPVTVLKTPKPLRCVQFHPLGGPLLLTAEVRPTLPTTRDVSPAISRLSPRLLAIKGSNKIISFKKLMI